MKQVPFVVVGLSLFINPVLAQSSLRRRCPHRSRRNSPLKLPLAFCLVAGSGCREAM